MDVFINYVTFLFCVLSRLGPMSTQLKQRKTVTRKRSRPTESSRPAEVSLERFGYLSILGLNHLSHCSELC